jgi:two-component system, LytTR family, response regulator
MKCILIDDEPLARTGLENLLQGIPSVEIVETFSNAIQANQFLQANEIDLMFLDIEMAALNGLDFARSLVKKPLIIFTTAYPQYALESFEVDAIDYLVKPVRVERLLRAINKAENYLNLLQKNIETDVATVEEDYVFIKSDRKFVKIFFKEILFIEGLKDYVIIHVEGKKVLTAMNIKTIFNQLPAKYFARVSKSFIVNTEHILSVDGNSVYIKEEEIPIGINFKDEFFNNYVNNKTMKR